jgi:hypothetical protein
MSETITDPVAAPAETPAPEPEAAATPAPEAATPEPPAEPEAPAKPDKVERRIANLNRKVADEARAREAAERRANAAEALLQADKPDGTPTPRHEPDIETRAAQIVAEREFNRRLGEIDATGKTELGAETWEAAKATLTGLGATGNQAFLQALAEAENPAKLFAHYADDTDALMELLSKSPAAMAAKLGRMDAQLSRPIVRPLSAAPAPSPKLAPSAVVPEANPHAYPPGMSMREWNKMMDAYLPPSLGGKKRAS